MIKSEDLKFNGIKVGVLYGIFIIFTLLVKVFDVTQYTAVSEYTIGFGKVNTRFQDAVTSNAALSSMSGALSVITDILAYSAFAVILIFAVIVVYQLVTTKSLSKVDYTLYCLAITYVIMVAVYVLFEVLVINYRPVMVNNEYEASYPSSHTMLAIVVYSTAMNQIARTFKYKKNLRKLLTALCAVVIAISVVGRLLCGIHWLTDIIGALLISIAIVETYNTLVLIGDYRHQTIKLRFEDDDVITDEISEPAEIDDSNF